MPMGRLAPRSPGNVPLGLVGALVLILLVEQHVERNPLDYQTGTQWSYRFAARAAVDQAPKCRVLCFGDSLLKLGLAPKVVEAESGLRAYNLALAGGQPPGSFFLLRRAIEAGARPAAVVVDFFPSMLATAPHHNDENWPVLADLRDCGDLARSTGDPAEFARLAVARCLPSARSRAAIRGNIRLAFEPSIMVVWFEVLRAVRNWKANRGAEIVAAPPPRAIDLDAWERASFAAFECLPPNRAYIDRFLDLAGRRRIPVFWVLPPYRPDMQARCERSGFDAGHAAFVRAYQARYPGLHVVDARHAGFGADQFVDPHHLARDGAARLSALVARTIRRRLREPDAPSTWTCLPAGAVPPTTAPLEDGAQSRRVVLDETRQGTARPAVR